MRRRLTWHACAVLVAGSITLSARLAWATKPVNVYSIYYSSDTTNQPQIEQFLGCLTSSSTFGTSWAAEWGVGPVLYHGATVLASAPPSPLQMGGSVDTEVVNAIAAGKVPPPGGNYDSIYLVHCPSNVACLDSSGTTLCGAGTNVCGEHGSTQYQGASFQVAIVPLSCPHVCSPSLVADTWIGEHEVAEALADEGTATFEVGDKCESGQNLTTLSCCGQTYTIQQLDTPSGPGACQTITATGSACTCGVPQIPCTTAATCCQGLACQPWVAQIGNTPTTVCCDETGQSCGSTNDCCGGLACKQGKCVCEGPGQFCLRDIDCCGGGSNVCDPKMQKCIAAPPDAGSDAAFEASADASPERDGAPAGGADGQAQEGAVDATADGTLAPASGGPASPDAPSSGCSCRTDAPMQRLRGRDLGVGAMVGFVAMTLRRRKRR